VATDREPEDQHLHLRHHQAPAQLAVPKDAAAQQFIVTPGPVYDNNDNVVQVIAANGAQGTATYDPDAGLGTCSRHPRRAARVSSRGSESETSRSSGS